MSPRCRPTWQAARCIRSRASRCRSASCGPNRAAICGFARPIPSSPRRCSRTICRPTSTAARPWPPSRRRARLPRRPPCGPMSGARSSPGRRWSAMPTLLEFCRDNGATIFHPSGTCRMGSDPRAVVDPRLRVNGIAGLARGRLLGHARPGVGQHQRAGRDDRREGRRHDQGGRRETGLTERHRQYANEVRECRDDGPGQAFGSRRTGCGSK